MNKQIIQHISNQTGDVMMMMMMFCIQTCQVCCKSHLVTTYLMLTLKSL